MISAEDLQFATLAVAFVAAVGGPLVALSVAKRQSVDAQKIAELQAEMQRIVALAQSDVQRHVANRQIVAPMRQAWINSLRDLLAEIFARSDEYRLKDSNVRSMDEFMPIGVMENRLRLLINPFEVDHQHLVEGIRVMLAEAREDSRSGAYWDEKEKLITLAQAVLKAEWNRTKSDSI